MGGRIEGAPLSSVVRAARGADPSRRARACREIGAQVYVKASESLAECLSDPVPGVRRAAAWASGWMASDTLAASVMAALRVERCDAPRLSLALAAVRCGAGVAEVWAILSERARRQLETYRGPRAPAPLVGMGVSDLELHWLAALCPGAVEPHALEPVEPRAAWEAARARVVAEPDDRQALLDLAVFGHPADLPQLLAATKSQGRRMRHAAARAIGLNGDPRGVSALLEVLHAVDVDPGHGFAGRAAAAAALGSLGLPHVSRALVRAMRDEALDHEGRPGAGLGIQRPVRATMLAALGELGDASRAAYIAGYLGNTTGTAHGGYYLQAMDAMVKLDAWREAQALLGADETTSLNAQGVLGALGRG